MIAVIEEIFRTRIDYRQQTWPELIPHVMFAINQMARSELQGKSSMYLSEALGFPLHVEAGVTGALGELMDVTG